MVTTMVFSSCGKKEYNYKPEMEGTFADYYDVENVKLTFEKGHNEFLNSDFIRVFAKFDIVKNDKDINEEIEDYKLVFINGHCSYTTSNLYDGTYRWGCYLNILDNQYTRICYLKSTDVAPLLEHFNKPGDRFSVEWDEDVSEFAVGADRDRYEQLKKFVNGELDGDLHLEFCIGGGAWCGSMEDNYE